MQLGWYSIANNHLIKQLFKMVAQTLINCVRVYVLPTHGPEVLICIFLKALKLSSFHMSFQHPCCLYCEILVHVCYSFLLSCRSSLCCLNNKQLPVVSVRLCSSRSQHLFTSSYHLLTIRCCSLNRDKFINFVGQFVILLKKSFLTFTSERCFLIFSFRISIVLAFHI